MSKQILESIQSAISQQGQSKELTIRLNPPELGNVCIKFQENQAELTGLLEVSKLQTRTEIEQALPQIIRNLAETGVDVKKIEVVLNDNFQSYQEAQENDSSFNWQAYQNNSNPAFQDEFTDNGSFYDWLSATKGDYQITTAETSINMLV